VGIVAITIIMKQQTLFITCVQLEAGENKVGVALDKGFVSLCGL
jgi:hypothetical protein